MENQEIEGNFAIIDDSAEFLTLFKKQVLKLFPKVKLSCFQSIDEFLTKVNEMNYKILFLDLHLRGEEGDRLLTFFPKEKRQFFVTAITADGKQEMIQKMLDLGVDDYLIKPVDLSVLKSQVESLIFDEFKSDQKLMSLEKTQKNQLKLDCDVEVLEMDSKRVNFLSSALITAGTVVQLKIKHYQLNVKITKCARYNSEKFKVFSVVF